MYPSRLGMQLFRATPKRRHHVCLLSAISTRSTHKSVTALSDDRRHPFPQGAHYRQLRPNVGITCACYRQSQHDRLTSLCTALSDDRRHPFPQGAHYRQLRPIVGITCACYRQSQHTARDRLTSLCTALSDNRRHPFPQGAAV